MMISIPVCQFGSRALILENLTIWQSIKRGWEVLTKNPGRSIGLYILLYFFAIVLFLIIGFPFLCYAFTFLSQANAAQVLPKSNPWVLVPANVLFRIFGGYIGTSLEVVLTIAYLNLRLATITPLDPWNAEAKIISAE
jgi:hypothetical protein